MPNLTGTAIRLLALLLMAGDAGDTTTATPGSQRSIDGDGVPFLVSVGLADVVGRTERRTRMGLLLPREESDGLVKGPRNHVKCHSGAGRKFKMSTIHETAYNLP